MQILIVEDSAEDAFLILQAFSTVEGSHAFVCRNALEAKAYLEGSDDFFNRRKYPLPDAIIADLGLTGESGLDFIHWLREKIQFQQIPTFVLSGSLTNKDIAAAQTLGVSRIMQKPRTLRMLERTVAQLVEELASALRKPVHA